MKKFGSRKYVGCFIISLIAVLFISTQVSAQVPYIPYYTPTPSYFIPPYLPPVAPIYPTAPVFNPFLATFPTPVTRVGAATIVLVPAATPTVTAAAPLGTLSITPTTLILLTLFLSLAE
ncbi:MAG: hypothetical protein AB1847_19240 [bacterium]